MSRIPGRIGDDRTGKPVALFVNAMDCSMMEYIAHADPTKAPAFVLADLGYDVWLGNNRGNAYSKRHVSLNTQKKEFWDFY